MKRSLLLLAVTLLCFYSYSQTYYYVDGVNGNNSNTGTSLEKPWKTIQKACDSATPNSIVQIKAGTYKENLVVRVSGTAGNPITFRNYGNDVVIIDGTGTSGSVLLDITDKSYLNFENLTIQNLTKNNGIGVLLECSENGKVTSVHFKRLTIKNINWINDPNATPGDDDNAQPFIAYGRGTTAEKAMTDIVIDSCELYDNIPGYSETLSLDGNINGFSITNNRVHHNKNIAIYVGGNYGECSIPSLDHTRNGIIERNVTYDNVAHYATSGGIYADGAEDVIIQRNVTYRNGYGIEIGCEENGTTKNITVINNLIYDNQESGIAVGGYTTETTGQVLNCIFRNNTLFQNDSFQNGSGEIYITKASNCTFRNNIFYTNEQNVLFSVEPMSPQASNTFNYNCWYTPSNSASNIEINWRNTSYTTFAKYKSGTGQDANSRYGNPGLINAALPDPDLHMKAGSTCINAGDPSTTLVAGETDFSGGVRVIEAKIDIGAYEFNNGIISGADGADEAFVFSVYPNPAAQVIEIAPVLYKSTLSISNTNGQELISRKTDGKKVSIDISSLPSGIYFVRLTNARNTKVVKMIKK